MPVVQDSLNIEDFGPEESVHDLEAPEVINNTEEEQPLDIVIQEAEELLE